MVDGFIQGLVAFAAVVGAIVAYIKARPEMEKTSNEAHLLQVKAQAQIIDDLEKETSRLRDQVGDLKERYEEEKRQMRLELDRMRDLNLRLQSRMAQLEERLKEGV